MERLQDERIPTNLRTLLILEVLGNSDLPMSPTEINACLNLPKQTIHRLCTTLVAEEFLVYDSDGKRLRPSRRLRTMASGILFASRMHIARRQILQEVALAVGETVNFVVPAEDGMSYLDRVETNWAFRVQLPIGTHVPFHCTASGKTFLATLSKPARAKMVNALRLEKLTPNTIDDPERLLEELAAISRQGYAIDNEEFVEGMVAIAVPVKDERDRFVAALAFHGPTPRLTVEKSIAMRSILITAAEKLRAGLFDE